MVVTPTAGFCALCVLVACDAIASSPLCFGPRYASIAVRPNVLSSWSQLRGGDDLSTAEGAAAAKTCAISLLAQCKAACDGDLDRLVKVVKLVGFVNSTADFIEQPQVINGASDFMVEALGDKGRHARSAVSAASLPLGVAVEIEAIFQIK